MNNTEIQKLRSDLKEARTVARDYFNLAKKWHAKHMGSDNADACYDPEKEKYPWLEW